MTRSTRALQAAALALLLMGGVPSITAQSQQPSPSAPAQTPQTQPPRPNNPFENVPQAPAGPAQNQPAQQPARPANPFETVPQAPQAQPAPAPAQQPAQPRLESPVIPPLPANLTGQRVDSVEIRGTRRVPQDTLKALIQTKAGDPYSEDLLRRDFMTLYNTGRFDDLHLEVEPGAKGVVVRFVVVEKRIIKTIDYQGLHSLTVSDILDRYKERKVGLSTEDQFDPAKVQRALSVLKDLLGEHGHQYATVETVITQVPPSWLNIVFKVDEGPKVKVGVIDVEGNKAFTKKWVVWQMKALRPIGIPHSILFEDIFSKTYDTEKLEYDQDQIRQGYMNSGYMKASIGIKDVEIVRTGGSGWRLPIFRMNLPSIDANITLQIDEGRQYRLHAMNLVGVKFFRAPNAFLPQVFRMGPGDVFSADKLKKGMEQLHKLYGTFGFMDFTVDPDPELVPNTNQVDLTLTADEGRQFFVRRIDFTGNTTTRDRVIRRELLVDEGDMFNMDLWNTSILRLNQLGYFEMLKEEDSTNIQRNPNSNTVDLTLKVKERGKNTIGLNGGVSGIAGSFVGFNYSTNNFLGLGETLSLESQIGTRTQNVSLGFTEPYMFDRPISAGIRVYVSRFKYNQAREASILAGTNLISLYSNLGSQNLLNYTQDSRGVTFSLGTHLRRSFAQIGISYGYDRSSITTLTTAAQNYFQYLNFTGVSGPNSLNGIKTSHITPSYTYSTVNHPITPTNGRSAFFSLDFAGSILGGNVNTIRPALDLKFFKQAPWAKFNDPSRSHVIAMHLMTSTIIGYGGRVAPPFARSFIGGEQDVRGFEIWGITPIAFIPNASSVRVLNSDGSSVTQTSIVNGMVQQTPVSMSVPAYQLVTPGGDTQVVFNFEYRIPVIGTTVQATPFFDAGLNKILFPNQLKLEQSHIDDLNLQFPQASFSNKIQIEPGTQKPRASAGLELEVMLPIVQAPFRVYFAYNPSVVRRYMQPPILIDRAAFPNGATFANSVLSFGQQFPFFEKRTMLRFTIGRTF